MIVTSLPPAPWFVDPTAAPPPWHYPFHLLDVGQATLVRGNGGALMACAERAAVSYRGWLRERHGITGALRLTRDPAGGLVIRRIL